MKVVLVLTLFAAFIFNLPLAFCDVAEEVLDIGGKPLSPGNEYYIVPAIRGPPGGGIRLGTTKNSKCPVTVLQDYSEVVKGDPVKFTPSQTYSRHIYLGITPLDIEFAKKPKCAESSEWEVFEDNKINKAYVGIGGQEAHPGQQMISGKFYIGKNLPSGFGYKLVFCDDQGDSRTCANIGMYDNNEGGRRLIITKNGAFDIFFLDASNVEDGNIKSVV